MFGRYAALLAGVLMVSGCVSDGVGTDYAAISQKFGPPKPGHSRVVVLQEKRKGLSMAICACGVKLDGEPIGKVAIGTWRTAGDPSVYSFLELDITQAQAYIEKVKAKTGEKITLTHLDR